WDGKRDPDVAPINLVQPDAQKAVIRRTMSNSFAFGGNNISLVMELAR
ncbi:MAG: beta-ketoacyl-[acyl-carrier-protein] synthase II, partial [Gammaproteobacteria bacterium]